MSRSEGLVPQSHRGMMLQLPHIAEHPLAEGGRNILSSSSLYPQQSLSTSTDQARVSSQSCAALTNIFLSLPGCQEYYAIYEQGHPELLEGGCLPVLAALLSLIPQCTYERMCGPVIIEHWS